MVHFGPSSHVQGVFLHDWVARQMPRCFCGEKWATWMCRNTEVAKIILFWKTWTHLVLVVLDSVRAKYWYDTRDSGLKLLVHVWFKFDFCSPCLLPNDPTDMINNDKHQRWEFHLVFFLGGVCQFENDDQSCVPLQQEVAMFTDPMWPWISRWAVSRCGAVLGMWWCRKRQVQVDFVSVKKILSNQLGMSQIVTSEFITTVDGRNPKQPPGM